MGRVGPMFRYRLDTAAPLLLALAIGLIAWLWLATNSGSSASGFH